MSEPLDRQAKMNTDRELWREREGDYYADSIHVTEGGGIGINSGGLVIVKPLREWHVLAQKIQPSSSAPCSPDAPCENCLGFGESGPPQRVHDTECRVSQSLRATAWRCPELRDAADIFDEVCRERDALRESLNHSQRAALQGVPPAEVLRMRQRVWNYTQEEYDDDDSFAVDIMEDFLKLLGSDLPRADPRSASAPPAQET